MKGVVFTEFIEFVEERFGFDSVDAMIEESGLSGVYTQAGNYPFEEMVALLVALGKKQNMTLDVLLETYGTHLFSKLATIYPNMHNFNSTFDIVEHIDNIIHPEVHKLYPDAELPSFKTLEHTPNKIILEYHSKKSLQHLAKGLILGAGKFYSEDISVVIMSESEPILIEVTKS